MENLIKIIHDALDIAFNDDANYYKLVIDSIISLI